MHYCFKSLGGANFPCEEVLQQLNRKQSIRPEANLVYLRIFIQRINTCTNIHDNFKELHDYLSHVFLNLLLFFFQ